MNSFRTFPLRLAVVLLHTVAAFFVFSGCSGVRARETVLMPVMAQSWTQVVAKEIAAAPATELPAGVTAETVGTLSASMLEGLQSGDRYAVRALDWALLRQLALAGIAARVKAGEIGPGVGLSLVETVNQFDRRFSQLGAR